MLFLEVYFPFSLICKPGPSTVSAFTGNLLFIMSPEVYKTFVGRGDFHFATYQINTKRRVFPNVKILD